MAISQQNTNGKLIKALSPCCNAKYRLHSVLMERSSMAMVEVICSHCGQDHLEQFYNDEHEDTD